MSCLFILEMGPDPTRPDPTRAYFWPAVNKRPTRLRPGYFPTRPEEIFFDPKGKKLKNLTFLGEIFRILTQTINGWPDPTRAIKNWPDPTRVKIFWPGPITSLDPYTFSTQLSKIALFTSDSTQNWKGLWWRIV